MSISVGDLAIGDYVHDESELYCVVDTERLINGRFLIRLERCRPSFVADGGEPFYDVRSFAQEDVQQMTLVVRDRIAA